MVLHFPVKVHRPVSLYLSEQGGNDLRHAFLVLLRKRLDGQRYVVVIYVEKGTGSDNVVGKECRTNIWQ